MKFDKLIKFKYDTQFMKLMIFKIFNRMDASLKELSNLVKEVRPDARKKGTIFKFQTVFFHNMAQRFKFVI